MAQAVSDRIEQLVLVSAWWLACMLVGSSCSPSSDTASPAWVRDSAGVRLIESMEPAWQAGEGWTVGSAPLVDFGPEHALHQIVAAFRLRDGRIVVAHASAPEFLLYSADGELLERHGRRGSGPGEFRELTRVRRGAGDSIVVYDLANARISVHAPDGRFARHQSIPTLSDGTAVLVEDVFGDGSLLVTPVGGPPSGRALTRRTRALWRVPHDTTSAPIALATFPEQEMYFFDQRPTPIAWRRPFFGNTAYYVAGRDRLYWGTTDSLKIRVQSLDGGLVSVITRRSEPRTFTSDDVERLIDEAVAARRDAAARPALRRALEELPTTGTVPAFGWPDHGPSFGRSLLVDDDANLWVAEYYMPGEVRNARAVFDSTGAWLGTVVLPPGFSPTHIGADFILGVWRDDADVEHVRVYSLSKRPTG